MKSLFKFGGFNFSIGTKDQKELRECDGGDVVTSSVKTPDTKVSVDNFEIMVEYTMEEFIEITKLSKDMLPDIMSVWKKAMMSML